MFTTCKAKFIRIVGERSGQKQDGSVWSVKMYLFETQENNEKYNKKIVLESFNHDYTLTPDATYNVAYEAESREWVGTKGSQWFTSLRFVGLVGDDGKLLPAELPLQQSAPASEGTQEEYEEGTELPF